MNNWRLLLLALAAVFQPIASFTEPNLVDGRRQCCDQLSSPLQDTRSSFHGTHRLEKTTTAALRRLNDRDEIHHERRSELRQRDSESPLTERRLLDIRASGSRLSVIANRFEYRLERRWNPNSRDLVVYVHERESTVKGRHLKPIKNGLDGTSRTHATQERNNHRGFENSRDRTFRNDHRIKRYGNERQSETLFDTHRRFPGQQIRSGELKLTLNRDARHILRQSTDEADRNMNNRPHIMRERLVRIESSVRADSRRHIDNSHERRQLERYNEQRRSLSENTPSVHRIRIHFRDENRENRQRLSVERFGVRHEHKDDRRESRQYNKENTDRNLSGERIQMVRRITRESRIMNKIYNEGERNLYSLREMGKQEMENRETRDEIKEIPNHRVSRERIQMDRRNNRIMNHVNRRDVDSRRENRNYERISRYNKDERENNNNLQERIQMERPNVRNFKIMKNVLTRNSRDIDSTRSIRYDNRLSRESRYAANGIVRENSDQRYTRNMIQTQQGNNREIRRMNTLNERDNDGQRQIRYNEKSSTELRREIRENPDHRLPSETIQMNRRHNHESRIINSINKRGLEIQQKTTETRHERLSREIRDEIRENSASIGRSVVRERRQIDRKDIRESRIINGVTTENARGIKITREIRYHDRPSRQVRDDQLTRESRRAESGVPGRMTVTEQRANSDRRTRSADSGNFRKIRTEPKLSRSAKHRNDEAFRSRVEHRDKIENREREAIEARFRNVELTRNRENINHVMVRKVDPENDSIVGNWQYVLYTLQAAYLCTLFMQILTTSRSEKPHKMNLHWLHVSSHYNPIKVD